MRLFVALDLPEDVREALPRPGAPWRAVPPENLHVTVAFLGDVDPDAAAVAALAPVGRPPGGPDHHEGAQRPGPLATRAAIMLPPRRPRVLAVELEDRSGACTALQAVVSDALAAAGVYAPEARPWLPHVTIG